MIAAFLSSADARSGNFLYISAMPLNRSIPVFSEPLNFLEMFGIVERFVEATLNLVGHAIVPQHVQLVLASVGEMCLQEI